MKFERVSKYPEAVLPVRKTAKSAGYDFTVAEDIIIPSCQKLLNKFPKNQINLVSLEDMSILTKNLKAKPTLVPTGIKCELNDNTYLELSVRSSCPLKYWLILANGIGVIDADYYNNSDNEGHIYFQLINLSPFNIILHKGDKIGQGIIHQYITTDDDSAKGTRKGGFGSTTE